MATVNSPAVFPSDAEMLKNKKEPDTPLSPSSDDDSESLASECPTPKPAAEMFKTIETINAFLDGTGSDEESIRYLHVFDDFNMPLTMSIGLVDKLTTACKGKRATCKLRALQLIKDFAEVIGRPSQPLLSLAVPLVLELMAERQKPIATAATNTFDIIQALAMKSPAECATMLPYLTPTLSALTSKWQSRVACLNYITEMSKVAPKELGQHLGSLIPSLTGLLHDLRAEVRDAANLALTSACGIVDNRDLQPFMPQLIEALAKPEMITECIHSLASLTFVQTVEAGALGVLVPLLSRGFKERKVPTIRCTAVIINNVSKLTDDPADGKFLLPELLPAVKKASDELSEPEARGVCLKAWEQLKRIEAAVRAAPPALDIPSMGRLLRPLLPSEADGCFDTVRWVSGLCCTLAQTKCFDLSRWEEAVIPYVKVTGAELTEEEHRALAKSIMDIVVKDMQHHVEEADNDDAEVLCDCKFTLAYGTKILLHNTELKLRRGYRYALLGGNDSGKSTLLRAIANASIEGFPPASEVRTVFVEADIQGEMSHLPCLEYVFTDERIKRCGISREDVAEAMLSVGFTEKMLGDPITTLSGGWRMKLALSRAMLQKADVLLMDEPTNHLDVMNVAWVESYLCNLSNVTSVIVSHNAGLIEKCCTHILNIENLKLSLHKGGLGEFVKKYPKARSFFELTASTLTFRFPQPGFIDGIKSKGKALMKMDNVTFTYPGNTKPTVFNATVQVSLASRVAAVGPNGTGKSTLIKLLTGELIPDQGSVWQHPSARIAYVAQHAFHHIEQHLKKTANEYIAWRYQFGEDKEALKKVTLVLTPEEEKKIKEPVMVDIVQADGSLKKEKRVIDDFTGGRKKVRAGFEYEVKFVGMSSDANQWIAGEKLDLWGFAKLVRQTDTTAEAREGMYKRPLTQANIEKHLADVGLSPEFATHTRMSALSGGQKVKVVLAAAMWNQPHILVLDEPTNYLDRESLGALAGAIREYEGGVVMITHNEEFAKTLCPETWVVENGVVDCKGDAEWMKHALAEKVEFKMMEEMVDGAGNVIKVKQPTKVLSRKEQKQAARKKKAHKDMGAADSDEDDDDY